MQNPRAKTVPVTVDDYHHMIEVGELTEDDRVQLLEGVIVDMAPIGARQRVTVTLLNQLLSALIPKGWHVACQQPVALTESEPEPDLSIGFNVSTASTKTQGLDNKGFTTTTTLSLKPSTCSMSIR